MDLNIDTTAPQYTAFRNGLVSLKDKLLERAPLWNKATTVQKKAWLQKDPLLKEAMLFAEWLYPFAEKIREELTNDEE